MPVSFHQGGNLDLRPQIIRQAPDPLELALKQAQLYQLQQDPKLRERALTLQALGLEHNHENDLALRKIQEANLLETTRHNTSTENLTYNQQQEIGRHNVADETVNFGNLTETNRYHTGLLDESKAGRQDQLTSSILAHLPQESLVKPEVLARTLSKRGVPEYEAALKELGTNKTGQTASDNEIIKAVVEPEKGKGPGAGDAVKIEVAKLLSNIDESSLDPEKRRRLIEQKAALARLLK